MKRILSLFLLLCSTAVFLAGCSNSQTPEAVVETGANGSVTAVAPTAESTLAQIGTTGRPQFLNVYASW